MGWPCVDFSPKDLESHRRRQPAFANSSREPLLASSKFSRLFLWASEIYSIQIARVSVSNLLQVDFSCADSVRIEPYTTHCRTSFLGLGLCKARSRIVCLWSFCYHVRMTGRKFRTRFYFLLPRFRCGRHTGCSLVNGKRAKIGREMSIFFQIRSGDFFNGLVRSSSESRSI